jgi:hypothetical protein
VRVVDAQAADAAMMTAQFCRVRARSAMEARC